MKIVAIGGYKSENIRKSVFDTPIIIDKKIVALSGKKRPHVLFIGTASDDYAGYIEAFFKIYDKRLRCPVDTLKVAKNRSSKEVIAEKIRWADVIYVGGGNTLKMMKRWHLLGVDSLLKAAFKRGVVLCGVSAGSICWFESGVSDSLQFYKKSHVYVRVRGLGFLPFVHNPHFGSKKEDRGFRTRGMKNIMKRTPGVCIALPDGCAMVFHNGTYEVISSKKTIGASIAYWQRGKYFVESIPQKGSVRQFKKSP